MGKNKHFKFMDLLNILGETEIHAFPKTWVKWISKVRENYGKTRTFQIYWFPKYFGSNRNPYNSQNMGKVNSHNTARVSEKTNILNLWIS